MPPILPRAFTPGLGNEESDCADSQETSGTAACAWTPPDAAGSRSGELAATRSPERPGPTTRSADLPSIAAARSYTMNSMGISSFSSPGFLVQNSSQSMMTGSSWSEADCVVSPCAESFASDVFPSISSVMGVICPSNSPIEAFARAESASSSA